LGLDDSWSLLGAIGSVIPRKGILYLVRALPRILATAPRTRLAIINEGGFRGYTAKVRAAVAQGGLEDHVLWLGPGNEVPRLLPALDVYVLPSLEESLPMAVLEAMAAGLPVVATSVGGVPECILPGETGLLVPPADCAALGEAVVRLLKDPAGRHRLGDAARRDIRKRFSPDGQVGRIEAALAGALARFRASHPCWSVLEARKRPSRTRLRPDKDRIGWHALRNEGRGCGQRKLESAKLEIRSRFQAPLESRL
jgi:glycosyltransferase involved in cell wall biosynthesis